METNHEKTAQDLQKDDMEGFVAIEKQRRIFKIIVIGDSNVGKTCLTYRFCGGKFPEKTEATIGVDFREKNVTVEGETIKVRNKRKKNQISTFSISLLSLTLTNVVSLSQSLTL